MKYVTLHHHDRGTVVVCALVGVSHQELAAPFLATGYRATSAGFARFREPERFETFGYSQSLQLTPHTDDARLLSAHYSAVLKTAPTAT